MQHGLQFKINIWETKFPTCATAQAYYLLGWEFFLFTTKKGPIFVAGSLQRLFSWSIFRLLWRACTRPAPWRNPELHQMEEIQECGHLPSETWARDILKVRRHCRGCKTLPQGLPSLWHTCGQVDGKSAATHFCWGKNDSIYHFSNLDLEPFSLSFLKLRLEFVSVRCLSLEIGR